MCWQYEAGAEAGTGWSSGRRCVVYREIGVKIAKRTTAGQRWQKIIKVRERTRSAG